MSPFRCQKRLRPLSSRLWPLVKRVFTSRFPVVGWLSIGLLVRLSLTPFWGHNDAVWPSWMAKFLLEGHWNVYQYLFDTFGPQTLKPIVWAPYPPLFYYLTAGWLWLIKSLGLLDLQRWISQWDLVYVSRTLFLLRIPYLVFDVGIWFFVSRLVSSAKRALLTALWALCPITLFTSYVMGQNDLYPTLFLAVGLYCAWRALTGANQSFAWKAAATISLGLGAGFKTFPLILLPLFVIFLSGSWMEAVSLAGLGVAPYFVVIAPFLSSYPFLEGSLFNPEGMKLFDLRYSIGGQTGYVFIIGYCAVMLYWVFGGGERGFSHLWASCLGILGLMYATSWWPFDWLVWSVPLLLLSLIECASSWPLYAALVTHFFVWTWWWGNGLGAGMLRHLSRSFAWFGSLREWTNSVASYPKVLGLSFSIFVAVLGTMLYVLFRQMTRRKTVRCCARSGILMSVLPFSLLIVNLGGAVLVGAQNMTCVEQTSEDVFGPQLSKGTSVGQTFFSPAGGLKGIRLRLRSVDRQSDGMLVFHLRESEASSEDLATVSLPVARITEDSDAAFRFPTLAYSRRSYYFFLDYQGADKDGIVVLAQSREDSYSEGRMFINHAPRATDLCFEAIYSVDWNSILYDLAMQVAADRVFFLVLGSVVALLLAVAMGSVLRSGGKLLAMGVFLGLWCGVVLLFVTYSPVSFSDRLSLLGHYLPSRSVPTNVTIPVRLSWKLREGVQKDYKVFVHLLDSEGKIVAQRDEHLSRSAGGRCTRTSEWVAGDWISLDLPIKIEESVSPESYQLIAGLYDLQTGDRLIPQGEDQNYVDLGAVNVRAAEGRQNRRALKEGSGGLASSEKPWCGQPRKLQPADGWAD